MPLNVISFATTEFHMYCVMINTNKVQMKQWFFFWKILCMYCDLNMGALLVEALCYKLEGRKVSL